MKKKIKDITFFDVNEACLKYNDCRKCPLAMSERLGQHIAICIISLMHHSLTEEWADYLEIEVDI